MVDQKKNYKAELRKVEDLAGFVAENAKAGDKAPIVTRSFLTSLNYNESKIMSNTVNLFVNRVGEISNLLVVVRNGEARIYRDFPVILRARVKSAMEKYQCVFKEQILDVEGVEFQDLHFKLDVRDGDKFLWLFRSGFNFGLYFDFTKKLKVADLSPILGRCYRALEYYAIVRNYTDSNNSKRLFSKGWFPFIQLIGDELERLVSASIESEDVVIESIVNSFSKEKVEIVTNNWWKNDVFLKKKTIILAGIAAFNRGTQDGDINCIKNLIPEIEGVARLSYHIDRKSAPNTKELKSYLVKKGKEKFSLEDSFGFPDLFADYLDEVIFKGFDVETGLVDFSRHSIGHGVAEDNHFTRSRALQCILTLDQIYFYLDRPNVHQVDDVS